MGKSYTSNPVNYPILFQPTGQQPLDNRTVIDYETDLTTAGTFKVSGDPTQYVGLLVVVKETGNLYELIGNDPTVKSNWKLINSESLKWEEFDGS